MQFRGHAADKIYNHYYRCIQSYKLAICYNLNSIYAPNSIKNKDDRVNSCIKRNYIHITKQHNSNHKNNIPIIHDIIKALWKKPASLLVFGA